MTAIVAVKEGVHAWRGQHCDGCAAPNAGSDNCTDDCCTSAGRQP